MHAISAECEKFPDLFMRKTYLPLLNDVRAQLARLVNADVEDCVMVSFCFPFGVSGEMLMVLQVANASVGANTVLWNIDWEEGDVIVGCESPYSARDVVF